MSWNKIILITIILVIGIGNCYAWDSEEGLSEGEYIDFYWNDEMHCFEQKNINSPSLYQRSVYGIKKIWLTIKGFFTTDVELDINYDIDKYTWDGSNYQQSDGAEFSTGISHNANQTKTTVSTFDPVEEYFKGNDTRVENWNGNTDRPDVLNVSVSIDGDGETLDDNNYGYVTLSDTEAENLGGGDTDYGFGVGKGAGGGSGGIYEGLNIGGTGEGDTTGMGSLFEILFWSLIPLIFILSVIKMVGKIL
jgi:hypothetical protein